MLTLVEVAFMMPLQEEISALMRLAPPSSLAFLLPESPSLVVKCLLRLRATTVAFMWAELQAALHTRSLRTLHPSCHSLAGRCAQDDVDVKLVQVGFDEDRAATWLLLLTALRVFVLASLLILISSIAGYIHVAALVAGFRGLLLLVDSREMFNGANQTGKAIGRVVKKEKEMSAALVSRSPLRTRQLVRLTVPALLRRISEGRSSAGGEG